MFQDGPPPGPGSVISELSAEYIGWIKVRWDTGNIDHYRMGNVGKYDLELAEPLPVTGEHHNLSKLPFTTTVPKTGRTLYQSTSSNYGATTARPVHYRSCILIQKHVSEYQ